MPPPASPAPQAQPQKLPAGFVDPIEAYLGYLELERGRSRLTIEAYRDALSRAAAFLARSRGRQDWQAVTREDAAAWSVKLGSFAPRTQMRMLAPFRGLAAYLVREEIRPDSFADLLAGQKIEKALPRALPAELSGRVVEAFGGADLYSIRNRAILELFYSSGLRASEICSLGLGGLDQNGGFVTVIGKGSKERIVPTGASALAAIARYLELRGRFCHGRAHKELFLSDRGRPMSRFQLWRVVAEASFRAGIDPSPDPRLRRPGEDKNPRTANKGRKRLYRVHPHALRHSFATDLLRGGAALRAVQEMLGHESVSTTEIYTKVSKATMIRAHGRFHPRNRRKKTPSGKIP